MIHDTDAAATEERQRERQRERQEEWAATEQRHREEIAEALRELREADTALRSAWADTVRCNVPLARAVERTLAAFASYREAQRG